MAKAKRNKKGQFIKKGAGAKKARRNGTKKGGARKTARKAYTRKPKRSYKARSNPAMGSMGSVIAYSSIVALGGTYLKTALGKVTDSPQVVNYGAIAAIGALGMYLTKKAKTKPAGYAVLGIAVAHLAEQVKAMVMPPESGAGFMSKSKVVRRLPQRVNIAQPNPVSRIYVPS